MSDINTLTPITLLKAAFSTEKILTLVVSENKHVKRENATKSWSRY